MILQTIKYSLISCFIITAFFCTIKKEIAFLGLIGGTLWGSLNLYLIEMTVKELLIQKNKYKLAVLLGIKFPFLYLIGYQLLKEMNPWQLMIGFILCFVVTFLSALTFQKERKT